MKTYIINLERSTRRRANIVREVERHELDYEIIRAVDGRQLSQQMLNELPLANDVRKNAYYSPTIIGAALSHIRVYERMLEGDAEVALVLEDDAVPGEEFGRILKGIQSTIKPNEVVMCHYMSFQPLKLSSVDSEAVAPGFNLHYPLSLFDVTSGAAYVLTRAATESLLAAVIPVQAEADAWELFHKLGGFETIRFVHPMPVTVRGDKSTIAVASQTWLRGWLTSTIDAYRVPPFYQILRMARLRSVAQRSHVALVREDAVDFVGNRSYEERKHQEDRKAGGAESGNLSSDALLE